MLKKSVIIVLSMKSRIKYILLFFVITLLGSSKAQAFCPVCTVTAAAAVGLSRWIGVDDTISGLWIGALTVAGIGWTINWMEKKKWRFFGRDFIIAISYFALLLIPFYQANIISFHPKNMLWGVDKLLLGMMVGSFFFLAGYMLYQELKKRNGGHAHFPFEKIVLPVAPLIIISTIFYFLTK